VNVGYEFDYKSTQEGITGIGLVLYLEDFSGDWHIAAGADPLTGALDSQVVKETIGNSRRLGGLGPVQVILDQPIRAGLFAQRALVLLHETGSLSPTEGKAKTDFTPAEIARIESLGRIKSCSY
jgi:hypothetical protein